MKHSSVSKRSPRSRAVSLLVGCGLVLIALITPVSASADIKPVTNAVGYDFSPGEPAIWGSIGGTAGASYDIACTAGFAIAGDSGFFLLTARSCATAIAADRSIRGDAGYYADAYATRPNDPTVLLRMRPGNDAHQYLVDPVTGAMPGDGLIRGWTRSVDQSKGLLIGKMGLDTGWTEGRILGTAPGRYGDTVLCTSAPASGADVGGPVWRNDSTGLRALGTVVGVTGEGGACYRPIQETLYQFGASLPSFGAKQGRPGYGTFAPGMPAYRGTVEVTFGGRLIDKGDDWR